MLANQGTQTLRWLACKAPADELDYTLDISRWLNQFAGKVTGLVTSVAPNGSGDIYIVNATFTSSGILTTTLASGVAGTDYAVTFTATLSGGQVANEILSRQVWLGCQYLSPEGPVPGLSIGAYIPAVKLPLVVVNGAVTLTDLSNLPTTPPTTSKTWWNNNNNLAQTP